MAFVKPYTYVNGNVLNATDQESNELALQRHVNQQIVSADVANDSIVGESIATPRLISAVYTADFVTKTIQGVSKLLSKHDFAYFSSTTKGKNQTSTTVEDYQSLNTTGAEVFIPVDSTKVMITIYFKAVGDENSAKQANQRNPGPGMWDNRFELLYEKDGRITSYDGTRNYVFEEANSLSLGALNPSAKSTAAGHRSIMITRMLTLDKGRYKFSVAVNPKIEKGNINCQSFLIETFHV